MAMEMDSGSDLVRPRVGLLYDERMCKHATPDEEYHPENPQRIKAIWKKLESAGIHQRCVVLNAKEAEDSNIALVHTKKHIKLIRDISSRDFASRRKRIASKFNSIYFNEGSSEAAYLAAGSVIEVSERVAKGELSSAVAIVRPPGHHAEPDEAMGFCLFNNVAIAASFLLDKNPELGISKILIVDWDVHHGNGTQKMFWKDNRVLFFSVHRFDFGTFYPSGDDGSHRMVGEGLGAGYNINVPWEHGQCGDADYFAVWDHILIPVAKAYNPDLILISGGFDAAIGDPLGGCCVTPFGYSVMMKKLMEFAGGKIVMALEGGYNLDSLAKSVLACVEALLEEKPIVGSSEAYPFESTWRVIQLVRQEISAFWPAFSNELPKEILIGNNQSCPVEECEADNITSTLEAMVQNLPPLTSSIPTIQDTVISRGFEAGNTISEVSQDIPFSIMEMVDHPITEATLIPSVVSPLPIQKEPTPVIVVSTSFASTTAQSQPGVIIGKARRRRLQLTRKMAITLAQDMFEDIVSSSFEALPALANQVKDYFFEIESLGVDASKLRERVQFIFKSACELTRLLSSLNKESLHKEINDKLMVLYSEQDTISRHQCDIKNADFEWAVKEASDRALREVLVKQLFDCDSMLSQIVEQRAALYTEAKIRRNALIRNELERSSLCQRREDMTREISSRRKLVEDTRICLQASIDSLTSLDWI